MKSVLYQIDRIHYLHDRWVNSILSRHVSSMTSPGQFRLLMTLWQKDGITQKELGKQVGLQKNTVSAMLAPLRDRGLIKISTDENDGRSKLVWLAEEGVKAKEVHQVEIKEAEDALLEGITPEDMEVFVGTLNKLMKNLLKENS